MIKIQNENIWDVNFSLNSKMVKNFNKTFNTKKIEKIENMFFKMFPNNYNDYKTNLININNDDKSISFNLNALMNLIEESLNDVKAYLERYSFLKTLISHRHSKKIIFTD